MKFKKIYLAPIKAYQYISQMLPASCRYYPSCSEYASWQFEFNAPHKAFLASASRILSCNQFFAGGIDYPLVSYEVQKTSCVLTFNRDCVKMPIQYWLVPKPSQNTTRQYYIVKDFNAINAHSST